MRTEILSHTFTAPHSRMFEPSREDQERASFLASIGVRFIFSKTLQIRLGHLAIEPYWLIKAQRAGYLPKYHFVLRSTANVVNPCLLDYWRPFFQIEPDRSDLGRLEGFPGLAFQTDPNFVQAGDLVGIAAQELIERELPGGLLTLTPDHWVHGLSQMGDAVGEPRPFVCLHVRDDGFFGKGMPYHSYRNADIETYRLACEEIVKRGSLVVVMGSERSKPFSGPGIFDYAHSSIRSDRMDIYLLGACKFFLGTASGPMAVAEAFGRPCVATNKAPMNSGPDTTHDLFIPKRYRKDGRFLTLEAIMDSDVRNFDHAEMFTDAGIEVVDNTPEEIREVVLEMLDARLETDGQRQFRALCQQDAGNRSLARIGRAFAQDMLQ